MKKNRLIACAASALLAFGSTMAYAGDPAELAPPAGAALAVTGTIMSSITLAIEAAGGDIFSAAVGDDDASASLGEIAKYGRELPGNFAIDTTEEGKWTLTSKIAVKVLKANVDSDSYTLMAAVVDDSEPNVVWKVGSATLSSTDTNVDTLASYSQTEEYDWVIEIDDDAAPEAIDNTITFTAVAN